MSVLTWRRQPMPQTQSSDCADDAELNEIGTVLWERETCRSRRSLDSGSTGCDSTIQFTDEKSYTRNGIASDRKQNHRRPQILRFSEFS